MPVGGRLCRVLTRPPRRRDVRAPCLVPTCQHPNWPLGGFVFDAAILRNLPIFNMVGLFCHNSLHDPAARPGSLTAPSSCMQTVKLGTDPQDRLDCRRVKVLS